jgi:hypothetical protein
MSDNKKEQDALDTDESEREFVFVGVGGLMPFYLQASIKTRIKTI